MQNPEIMRNEKIFLILICLPLVMFIGTNQGYFWDEAVFLGLSNNIPQGNYYINLYQESYRPPLFPMILSVFYLSGDFLKIIPIIFTITTIITTYYLVKKIINQKVALLSAAFIATAPWIIYYSQRILTETLFMMLFTASVFLIYLSTEKKKLLPLTFSLFGLVFLAKYQAILLIPIFFFYILIIKKTSILKTKEFFISLVIFLIILVPWFYIGFTYYTNPYELYIDQLNNGLINPPEAFQGPFYFYIINSIGIFGVSIILLPLFLRKKVLKNKFNILLLISMIIIILFFSTMERKEYRYIVSFSGVFYIAAAYSLISIEKNFKDRKVLFYLVVALILATNLLMASQVMLYGKYSGQNVMDASLFLQQRVTENDFIIGQNYPVINYFSNANVLDYPKTEEEFTALAKKYNVKYFVVDYGEFGLPDYINEINSEEIAEFGEDEYKVIVNEIPS